jgi:undecaprenyl-diphosphatase
VRGGEGDLAAELEDGEVQGLLVAGLGHRADVVLEHVDGDPDEVDGLLEGDHPHQLARGRTEHLTGQPGRSAGVAAPLHEGGDPRLRHESHPGTPFGGHLAEPRQLVVHPCHRLGGQGSGGPLEPAQRRSARPALAPPTAHVGQRVTAGAVGESGRVSVPPDGSAVVTRTRAARAVPVALAVLVLCLTVLALLGAGVRTRFGPQLRLDAVVSEALYAGDDRAGALDVLLEVLTAPGLSVVRFAVFLPVLVLLLRRKAWWTASWLVTAVVLVAPLTGALKAYFGRVRPDFAEGGARYESLSYPSGHSSGIATLVTVALVLAWPLLAARARRLAMAAGVVAVVLVGLTRMWLGVHFLSDVVGGWALGVAWTLLTALLFGAFAEGRASLRPTA